MTELIYVSLAVAPGLFLLLYFYLRDKYEREPPLLVLGTFGGGALLALPAFALGRYVIAPLLTTPEMADAYSVLLAPLIEESAKFFAVLLIAYPRKDFNEPMDGIVYACAAALGFASLENVTYVLGALGEGEQAANRVLLVRTLISVPGHALFAIPWGIALGLAKFDDDPRARKRRILGGLAMGLAFHSGHNLLAVASPWIGNTFLFALAIFLWFYANRRIKAALAQSPFKPISETAADADRD